MGSALNLRHGDGLDEDCSDCALVVQLVHYFMKAMLIRHFMMESAECVLQAGTVEIAHTIEDTSLRSHPGDSRLLVDEGECISAFDFGQDARRCRISFFHVERLAQV